MDKPRIGKDDMFLFQMHVQFLSELGEHSVELGATGKADVLVAKLALEMTMDTLRF